MMRSMFSGVSGLRAHQVKMDVIGNNIANVNTVGYKGSKVQFSEVFSQTVKGASGSSSDRGGTNPQQIGLGIQVGSIDVMHTKGSSQRTDNVTDLMIDGNGFFVVSSDDAGLNKFYSRAGNFNFDESGNLVTSNGFKVFGQQIKEVGGVESVLSEFAPIKINKTDTNPAVSTDAVDSTFDFTNAAAKRAPMAFSGNIDINESKYTTTFAVYDALGNQTTVKAEFGPFVPVGTNAGGTRAVTLTPIKADGTNLATPVTATMTFDANGDATDFTGSALTFTPEKGNTKAVTLTIDKRMITKDGNSTGTTPFVSGFHQYRMPSDIKMNIYKGNAAGAVNGFNIGQDGKVQAVFTNGEKQVLGRLKLADFDNPAGLMKVGNNMFSETTNSGAAKYGQPATGSFGALTPGALEMSNVDLAAEFTDMITTQRGFQANSRIITTSDEILQELVNLKR